MRRSLVVAIAACGGATVPLDDGGTTDATVNDVTTLDANADGGDSGAADATVDVISGVSDAGKKPLDAPYVDLDAASVPWATTLGIGAALGVAVDGNGNVLVGGELDSIVSTFFLQELDQSGKSLWKQTATTSSTSVQHAAYSVAFDPAGNAIAAGLTGDALDVGGGALGPGGFIVKYDASGNFQWEYGPFPNTLFRRVRTKSNGNIVAVGYLTGSDNYGGGMVSSGSYRAVVLVEVTSSQAFVSANVWGGGDQLGFALAVDGYDDVFIAGRFAETIDFGGGSMTGPSVNSGQHNLFIAEFDSSGAYQHQLQAENNSANDDIIELATDWSGNLIVGGGAANSVTLGGSDLGCGAFVGMLDGSLGHLWSKCFKHTFGAYVAAVPIGGAMTAGPYQPDADLGQGALPDYTGVFLAQFGSTGTSIASFGTGSMLSYYNACESVAYLTWPDFVIVGECRGDITLPSGVLSCNGGGDVYVARLKP